MVTGRSVQSFARTTGYKDNSLYCMGLVRGADGEMLQQSDISSISYRVVDKDDGDATPSTGTLTISDVVFDTPQTASVDDRWPASAPSVVYNFGGEIPGSAFPDGGKTYFVLVNATVGSSVVTLYCGLHATRDYY